MLHHKDRARLLNAYSSFSIHIILLCRDVHRYGGHVRILYIIRIIGGHFLLSRHLHLFFGFPPPASKVQGMFTSPAAVTPRQCPSFQFSTTALCSCMFSMIGGDAEVHTFPVFPGFFPGFPGIFRAPLREEPGPAVFLIPAGTCHARHDAINKYPNVFIFFNFMFFILSPLSRRIPV